VTIVHRRDELRAGPTLQKRAFANGKIDFVWDTVIDEIEGNGVVQGIKLHNVKTGEAQEMPVDGVFIFIGHYPNSQFLVGQVAMDEHGYVITDEFMRTNVAGVYAAGEIQDPHFRQIATSVGQGVAAAMQLERWLGALE
jgi:thioredoxin reductase (NADPH)